MGWIGGLLAVFGVVACPITSGDTAFRSARLSIADALKFNQRPIANRLLIAIPLFIIGVILVLFSLANAANFNIVWRYFSWSNQTLATIGLWAVSAYLAKTGKNFWITLIPAAFMTVVVTSYILIAKEGFGRWLGAYYIPCVIAGIVLAVVLFALFISKIAIKQRGTLRD
jgi:carbon starvation protein CstA